MQPTDVEGPQTLTRHTVMPFLVSVQKRDLRGLETRESTGSGGILGSGGTVQIRFADDVGKYIRVWAIVKAGRDERCWQVKKFAHAAPCSSRGGWWL